MLLNWPNLKRRKRMERACKNCKYVVFFADPNAQPNFCHRLPPMPRTEREQGGSAPTANRLGRFPLVLLEDWCGEFQPLTQVAQGPGPRDMEVMVNALWEFSEGGFRDRLKRLQFLPADAIAQHVTIAQYFIRVYAEKYGLTLAAFEEDL